MSARKQRPKAVGRTNWRQQLLIRPELADLRSWPIPDLGPYSETAQDLFWRRRTAIAFVVGQRSAAGRRREIEVQAPSLGIGTRELYRLLDRCLGSPPDGAPALSMGLLPHARVVAIDSGAFAKLLRERPGVFDELRRMLRDEVKGRANGAHHDVKQFHSQFIDLLVRAGIEPTAYPFNTRGRAVETLRKWRRAVEQELRTGKGLSAAAANALMSARDSKPMDCFQLDEHKKDFETGLLLDSGFEQRPIRVARFWVVAAVDEASSAIFGYSWGYSANPRADEILECLDNATRTWTPMTELPPGLSYSEAGGMPSKFPEFEYAIPTMLKMDNGMAHFAGDVHRHVQQAWNSVLNLGRPKFPIARMVVEAVFRRLAVFEHQMPSTTGASPTDPRRDRRRSRAPLVPVSHIGALLDVIVAELNGRRRPDLGGYSPLEILKHWSDSGGIRRVLPERFRGVGAAFRVRRELMVRGNLLKQKPLHINFCYAGYRSDFLARSGLKPNERVLVEFDRRDLRTLTVLDEAGTPRGEVTVQGHWRRFQHDERLRTAVYRLAKERSLSELDALTAYFRELANNADKPSSALRLLDLERRIGIAASDEPTAPTTSAPEQLRESPDEQPEPVGTGAVAQWIPRFPTPTRRNPSWT